MPDHDKFFTVVVRFFPLLVGVGVLGAAVVGDRAVEFAHADRLLVEARAGVLQARQRASDALAAQRAALEAKLANAASNPRLVAAVGGGVDARTLHDLLDNEVWWERTRRDFPVQALLARQSHEPLYARGALADVDVAAAPAELWSGSGLRSQLVKGRQSIYLLGMTAVETAQDDGPWLILARPLQGEILEAVAARAGVPLFLTDGTRGLATAGRAAATISWTEVIGRERASSDGKADDVIIAADRAWVAASTAIDENLWLWVGAETNLQEGPAQAAVMRGRTVLWSSAGLGMVGVAMLARRRRRRDGTISGEAALATTESSPRGAEPTTIGRPAAVGRYLLLERIGQGGMAEVFAAVTFGAEGFRRHFVIKRMRPELASNAEAVDQFIDEANLGSNLVHPNIVSIFDFGKAGSGYYLAQEYVPGRDLGQVMRRLLQDRGQVLSAEVVLWIANQVLHALEYAHGKRDTEGHPLGIVHRDITPENVMVSEVGEVKLVDFGVVKADHGRVARTEQGQVKGSVAFMAPEQARGQDVDGRADLYSLGLVMFYCMTGRMLFDGATTYDVLLRAACGPMEKEQALIAQLPAPCDAIVARALAPLPADRYQSAAAFRAALAPYLLPIGDTIEVMVRELFGADLDAEHQRIEAALPRADQITATPASVRPAM